MKTLLLPIILMLAMSVQAQTTISFAYDDAGNRISRMVNSSKQMQDSTYANEPTLSENEKLNNQVSCSEMMALLYPNPATENFTLELSNYDGTALHYFILGMSGGLYDEGIIRKASTLFNASKLSKGVYILQLEGNAVKMTKKLVIK